MRTRMPKCESEREYERDKQTIVNISSLCKMLSQLAPKFI